MHQDDLSGRLLAQQAAGGDKWEVVESKAVWPDGAALWPEKFDAGALARIKANTTSKDWVALYQQEPTPDEGTYFKDEWFSPYVGEAPTFMNVYGASAISSSSRARRSEVSCNDGAFAVGVVADAPPAITKEAPAAPNAGKVILRRVRFETRFACAIVGPPMPASRSQDTRPGHVDFMT